LIENPQVTKMVSCNYYESRDKKCYEIVLTVKEIKVIIQYSLIYKSKSKINFLKFNKKTDNDLDIC
jgi:hypothetical protein